MGNDREDETAGNRSGYSLDERDRRWQTVRENAARAGFDCIFVPLGNGTDGRYLTGYRAASVVLPTIAQPPIVIINPLTERGATNSWVPEPRRVGRKWGEAMAQALLDSGMEQARIGVAGMSGGTLSHVRAPDGVVNHSSYAEVVKRLPKGRFEDATNILGFSRYVKSVEEVECLRQSAAIAEAGIEEMVKVARPGLEVAVLYARVMESMLMRGSEYYPLALSVDPIGTPERTRYASPPTGRRLEANALITNEVSAIYSGQIGQEVQPLVLGSIPEEWKPVMELQRNVFYAGVESMKPGAALGELIDLVNELGKKRGMKTITIMHGLGYGDDGPLLTPREQGENVRDLRLEEGNTFVWKPSAMTQDEQISFVWGGGVVVTENGAKPLFKRGHGIVAIK